VPAVGTSRFAPSSTGHAHPGTLLSGLLVWLDARARGDRAILRLEDLDVERASAALSDALVEELAWFGLGFDATVRQRDLAAGHAAALDALAARGALYPCACSRAERQAGGRRAPDGGFAYDNRCRARPLPPGGWRASSEAVRCRLPDRRVELVDEGGRDLSQTPALELGDPIVVRRDRVVAYHLVVVVDDAAAGVTRVVRGHDLASATATQVLLHELLELPLPRYRHHLLLLEPRGDKLAKLHGSVAVPELRRAMSAEALCGVLAAAAGLAASDAPVTPGALVAGFDWGRVATDDVVVRWDGARLAPG
jgi:glutamyl/glutaminyl-tRNA synthetase